LVVICVPPLPLLQCSCLELYVMVVRGIGVVYIGEFKYTCTCTYIHVNMYIYARIYVYIHTSIYTYIHISLHMYVHVHT